MAKACEGSGKFGSVYFVRPVDPRQPDPGYWQYSRVCPWCKWDQTVITLTYPRPAELLPLHWTE